MSAGCRMLIALGKPVSPLLRIEEGAPCTWFLPSVEPRTQRKRWIAATIAPAGALTVDDGAAAALGRGKSLLPAGIVAVEGNFDRGD